MTRFQLFTRSLGAFVIDAENYKADGPYTAFYNVSGTGQETTFPEWWQRLLGKKKERRTVQIIDVVEFVLAHEILRLRIPAQAIEAQRAATVQQGAVHESAVLEEDAPKDDSE